MGKIQTIIGKDVIESLTLGMYEDCRFVYREYIQNAADQIDKAVEDGLLKSNTDGKIEIEINQSKRSISIKDNATGIEKKKVAAILKNIAQSTKDRSKNKGFRGIGRLGGLAYCDRLIFETSYKGEKEKSILVWDAQKLKAIINNRAEKEEATTVIDAVTSLTTAKDSKDSSYFIVTMEGVSNEILLDKKGIYDYLAMVAPVAYSKGFVYKSSILKKAKSLKYTIDEYPIYVNNNQVFKEYKTSIYDGEANNKKKIDDIHDIELFEIRDSSEDLVAWGWYSISSFTKQIPKVNLARGMRLRKGNIQIGLDDCLVKLFKESRGSFYFFGEVHAVHPGLIPNARRDYFLDNDYLLIMEIELRSLFAELQKLYHFSSKVRNTQKKIDDFVNFSKEFEEKSKKKGFTDDREYKNYRNKFEEKKEQASKAEKELSRVQEKVNTDDTAAEKKVLKNIVKKKPINVESVKVDESKTKYITDDLTKLSRKDKQLVSRIFKVLDNILPKDLANIVKEKVKEELM